VARHAGTHAQRSLHPFQPLKHWAGSNMDAARSKEAAVEDQQKRIKVCD
jgi:hypothetical protein